MAEQDQIPDGTGPDDASLEKEDWEVLDRHASGMEGSAVFLGETKEEEAEEDKWDEARRAA